jgi:hypothetical protein
METFKKLFLLFLLMSISSGYALTDYCATPRASTNPAGTYSVNYTCRNVGGTTYEYKLEFAVAVSIANANIGVDNINPGGTFNIGTNLVLSNGNKTASVQFTSSTTPHLYVNYIAVVMTGVPGVVEWNQLPVDANWTASCASTTAPLLTTTAATGINASGATMNGNISSNGGANITSYGFYWSTTNGFANGAGTQVVVGTTNTTGAISSPLTGLSTGTYYYKAYATNSIGTTYGAQQQFTTSANPPPAFGAWTLPDKALGDATFTITPPTTDSGGLITYTSGTPSVASIVNGNQIQINGIGTSVITLDQAADASHAAGSTTATLTVTLGAAPTPPARNAWDVVSLYSGAYTNIAGVVHQVGVEVSLSGNPTRYIQNMLLSRMAFGNTNVSAMTTLHADVYCPTIGTIWLQFQGGSVTKTVSATGWQSIDVPLTDYPGVNFTAINFFDFNNPTGAVAPEDNVYFDNVYFYRSATTQPPTLGAFTVPAKNLGDADFAITPPTSNSAGAWSYTSSNTGVATIVSGNMIHIVNGGTSTITATQAADGVYGQGVATATFTVSFPALTTAAPTPPERVSTDVMSVYSDAYTPVPGTRNYNPNWGQATVVTNETIGADNLLKYTNLNYQGINIGSTIDVSGMQFMHIDVYTPNETSLTFSLISTADGVNSSGERAVSLTPLTQGGWNSYDIPLTSYTSQSGFSVSSIFQLKTEGSGGKIVYVDNIYFWKPAAELINPTITLADINKELGDADFTVTATSDSPGTITYGSSNPAVATISGNTVHIVGAGTATITANQAASGLYNPGSTTATLTVTVPPLTTAAPTPPARNDWDVISLYSEAYPTLVGATWQHGSDVFLEGNTTRYLENMLLARLAFPPTNVSAMTTLHIDVYSETLNPTWFELQGIRVTKSTPVNGWVSLDIPLSQFTGLNLNSVNFFDLNNPTGAVAPADNVYVDNVYFYRPATTQPATLSDFSIPTKAYNDPDFEITPPTSNSTGTFSYTSSNTAVATIVNGNMIHIVGGGTSTITAIQAPDGGSYGTASITAPFTVTFAPPPASPVPPARTPDRVVSMFTGTPPVYADAIVAQSAPWSSATMDEVPNGTNTALQLSGFGVLGLTGPGEVHFGVTGMSHLHIDFDLNEPLNASPALSRINVFLLANGDYLYPINNLTAGWNSISIPLTSFSGANLADVWGLKLESINPATQIYIDNVYFSNECYTYYADTDSDTYGDPANTTSVCDGSGAPAGYVTNSDDCDDTKNTVHPGAAEIGYNLIDDDCDGSIDEGFAPKVTVIQSAMCNANLAAIDTQLTANLVAGVQGYRWRITTMTGPNEGQVQELDTALRALKLTQLPSYAFATQYKVEVAVYYSGYLQPFTPSTCTVTTPSPAPTLSNCGQTLTTMANVIYANLVPFVSGYRFRITDPVNATNTQVIERNVREFRMNLITAFAVQYNKLYNVEVSVKNTDGSWLPYGGICNVTTPAFPTTSLQDSQCDNFMVPNNATQIYASSYSGAVAYVFQLSGGGLVSPIEVTRSIRTFTLNDFAGQLTPGATYNVKVRLIFNFADPIGPYGKTCSITVPGLARTIAGGTFDAVAYPNPYTEVFNIDLTTSSSAEVNIRIYDMTGRLLENKNVNTSKANTVTVGENFPSGIYNVIVSQGDEVKTLRVIKR